MRLEKLLFNNSFTESFGLPQLLIVVRLYFSFPKESPFSLDPAD